MKKNILKSRRGQSLIEFALILPVLLMLLLGVVEFGWLLNGKITVNSAAREGARVGAVVTTNRPAKVLEAVTETAALSGLTIISAPVTEENDYVNNKHNVVVTVNATMSPIIGLYVTEDVDMTSVAKMRRE